MKLQAMTPEEVFESKIYLEWGLSDQEYQTIEDQLGRKPTYTETGLFSGMWSEHCSYKSSKPVLKNFYTEGDQILQGPGEGAGIVDIGDGQGIVFKMESHNSPSAKEPYEGAATGVGGVVRDVFSMGATPIASVNSLRFGNLDNDHTRYLVDQAFEGIADYGNRLGVPTLSGETKFDAPYQVNPMVNAMTVGLLEHKHMQKGLASGAGNVILYAGSSTGRDGIHGASFSSKELSDDTDQGSAVQAGDPFKESLLVEACLELMQNHTDQVVGIQDMGAAGLVSSSSEMAEKAGFGIDLNVDYVPQREENMTAYEMLLSESQERMLICVKQGFEQEVIDLFQRYNLEASVIGKVTDDGRYRVSQHGEEVVNLPVELLADGVPTIHLKSEEPERIAEYFKEDAFIPEVKDVQESLENLMASEDLASIQPLYSQYDSMAKNNTLVGPGSDAGVLRIEGTNKALAITSDCNSRFVYLDPFIGGQIAVSEAARNVVASGAKPLAITDALNFGKVQEPEVFYELEQSSLGISRACQTLNAPVISGNVSLNNGNPETGSIYPTPIIGMVGLIEDASKVLTQSFKASGQAIYLVGETKDDFSGSVIQKHQKGYISGRLNFDMASEAKNQDFVYQANQAGYLMSAHDLSEGGFLPGLVEKTFHTDFGFEIEVDMSKEQLFSESQSRFIVTVPNDQREDFEASNPGVPLTYLGQTTDSKKSSLTLGGEAIVIDLDKVEDKWRNGIMKLMNQ